MFSACSPYICSQRLFYIFFTHPCKNLLHQGNRLFQALGIACFIPDIPDQNPIVLSIRLRKLFYISAYHRFHLRFICDIVSSNVPVLGILIKRCNRSSTEIAGNRFRLRPQHRLGIFGFCNTAVIKQDRHHSHMIQIQER